MRRADDQKWALPRTIKNILAHRCARERAACHIHFLRLKKAIMKAAIPIMITHNTG
jgi:hypothetical protein